MSAFLNRLVYCTFPLVLLLVSCAKEKAGNLMLKENEQISYNFHIRPILSDNCFACHGPDAAAREAGLRLDLEASAYAALSESPGKFAIVPGKSNESEVFHRITNDDPLEVMPPPNSNLKLSEEEIALIKKWIEQGAKYEPHWAFVPPIKVDLPKVSDKNWPKNPIDYFTLAKMESFGLKPNPKADPAQLLKRISFDLTGLPPSLELQAQFQNLNDPNILEKLVDELLAQSAYGEKMAALWMDISRYADSYGYQDDNIRTQWPYRDWVIHAFNQNLPYDTFVTWQLAGDLLPEANKEQILATAFNRNHKYTEEGGVIPEEYRVEYVLDKTNTFSKGILGITMECAQCHDHKYDPFSQKEYFELYAFFNNTPEKGYEGDVVMSKPAKTPILWIDREDIDELLHFIHHLDTTRLMVSVMEELDTLRTTYILDRGLYDAPSLPVSANTPTSILPFPDNYPKNRLGLAQWTVSKENPLTARVFVNLIWQEIFGQGIVKTAGDFGMQGDLPSHPELLDWLAVDFMESGWDIKKLFKKIIISATYQQSSEVKSNHIKIDPDNFYLARSPRIRFTAENVRDLVLASSGLLVPTIGGPSVKPYQPEGLWEAATSGRGELKNYIQDSGDDLYRRGLYTFIKLTVPPPMPIIFDASNRDVCEIGRPRTNTPLQALVMMNDPLIWEASRFAAVEHLKEKENIREAIELAFSSIVCRKPDKKELDILTNYYKEELGVLEGNHTSIQTLLEQGDSPILPQDINAKTTALTKVIVLIYNLEEAITKS